MTRPVVGINCELEMIRDRMRATLCDDYVQAIVAAGGLPLLLPHLQTEEEWREALSHVDALVLSGGDDLDPGLYGEAPHPADAFMAPRKQSSDLALIRLLFERKLPVLGICYGAQLLAVARGGTLVQDIPSLVGPTVAHAKGARHDVEIDPASRIGAILGAGRLTVLSWHHQSVGRPGRGVQIVARSSDGVVEAVEDGELPFFLGVQWHPERMPDAPEQRRLFEALVAQARGGK